MVRAPYFIGTTTSIAMDVNKFFKGDIDKVMMWDRKLEEKEIQNIYKRPVKDGLINYSMILTQVQLKI